MVLTSSAYMIKNNPFRSQQSTQGPPARLSPGNPGFSHTELLVHRHSWPFKTSVQHILSQCICPSPPSKFLSPFETQFRFPLCREAFLTPPGLSPASVPPALHQPLLFCAYDVALGLESLSPIAQESPKSRGGICFSLPQLAQHPV